MSQTVAEPGKQGVYSERGNLLFDPDALNVYINVPCPLKVRFHAELSQFLEDYNRVHSKPVYCPTLLEDACHGLEDSIVAAQDTPGLPDLWITMHFQATFTDTFKQRFLETGKYIPFTPGFSDLPASLQASCRQHHLGLLAFSYWSCVCDEKHLSEKDFPSSWADMTDSRFQGLLGATGHGGKLGGMTLLMHLYAQGGAEAVSRYAANMNRISHFSQMIKSFGRKETDRPQICAMPNVAIRQIPSTRKIAELEFPEGRVAVPVMCYVKPESLEACQPILDFMTSSPVTSILRTGDIVTAGEVDWTAPQVLPDWDMLGKQDFSILHDQIMSAFYAGLPDHVEF